MPRKEHYQLSFDFSRPAEPPRYYEIAPTGFLDAKGREPGLDRFVRSVKEEVFIRAPLDAAQHFLQSIYTPFDSFTQEELWVLLLNTKNRITHEALIYRGSINTVQVRLAEIFRPAVRVNAPALLLSHCHPSGDPTPSPEDIRVTQEAVRAGQLLDITLLDHIVLGRDTWVSLKERGLGFDNKIK